MKVLHYLPQLKHFLLVKKRPYLSQLSQINLLDLKGRLVLIYHYIGFVFLAGILCFLFCYFTLIFFFLINSNWAIPFILDPHSEKVLSTKRQIMALENELQNSKIKIDDLEKEIQYIQLKMNRVDLHLDLFYKELSVKIDNKKIILKKYQTFLNNFSATDKSLQKSTVEQLDPTVLKADYNNKLMTSSQYMEAKKQLMRSHKQQLDEEIHHLDLKSEAKSLKIEIDFLVNFLEKTLPSYKENKLQDIFQFIRTSPLDLKVVSEMEDDIKKLEEKFSLHNELQSKISLSNTIRKSLKHQNTLLNSVLKTPYAKAKDYKQVLAFVPYEHLENVSKSQQLYSCYFKIFWCNSIGTIDSILDSEVVQNHPLFQYEMRGKIIEIQVSNMHVAEDNLFHIGRSPYLGIF